MKKAHNLEILLIIFFSLFIFVLKTDQVRAQTPPVCEKMTVGLVIRNSQGEFIPNANFEIYQQVDDVDGNPKPGKKVASGKISATLGKGTVTFTDENYDYAVKVWTISSDKAAFWFYNDLHLACGGTTEISEYLSGIDFILRDTKGGLRKNTNFSIYSQREDVDNKPIKEKLSSIGTFNTGEVGEVRLYVPSGSRAIDGNGSDYFIFESPGKNGGTFVKYDISVSDKNTVKIDYVFSDFELNLKDANGQTFPGNTKIEIYKQAKNANGDNIVGVLIKEIFTDDLGSAILEYPAGEYAARIKGSNSQYQYFWDLDITDQKREVYDLKSGESWDPGQGACTADSLLTISTRGLDNKIITGLKFELYERILDANKNPLAGTKLGGGTIDQTGKAILKINPDSRKKYAIKIYDKNVQAGDFWFFDEIQFTCGENKEIIKVLPALNIILRDGYGKLKKNQKFSLYTQKFDVDFTPITVKSDLIGNFSTTDEGNFIIYLAPDHPYNLSKRGVYVFSASTEGGGQYNEYFIQLAGDSDYKFEYTFSDVVFELKDARGNLLKNKTAILYEQAKNSGKNSLGKNLKNIKTDNSGQARLEYPAGQYALAFKDDLNQDNIFWDILIKNRVRNIQTITANLTRVSAKDSAGKDKRGSDIIIYSLIDDGASNFVINKKIKSVKIPLAGYLDISLAPAPYLLTTMYGKQEYGQVFYTENGKSQTVKIETNQGNLISTGKKFKLAIPAGLGSLSERLKGYILLQVESRGEAWYVNPSDGKRYFLQDGATAYEAMKKFGIGASDENLKKIIIGMDDRLEEFDYDGDGLPDDTESAIGTDMYDRDSDDDGFADGTETNGGYNPLGSGKWGIDKKFSDAQKGRIILQVEQHGEAWYVNPKDSRRFYMKDGDSAYKIMRFLSLGVKNSDLEKIEVGKISN
jgi:hypothetical protein